MKRIINMLMLLLLCASGAFAQAELSLEDFKIMPGETKEVMIDMTSVEENIVTVGAIISLPEGLAFEKVYSRNRSYIDMTDRKDDHTVTANLLADGSLKFLATSLTLAPFFETSGPLFKITVKADENAALGNRTISIKKAELTTETVEYKQELVEANVTFYKNFTVGVASDNDVMGAVEGAGTYESNTEATIKATANTGYHFEKWSNDVTDNPYTFVVADNIDLNAIFAPNKYTVTFMDGETVVSTEELDYASAIDAPETNPVKVGHTFVGWYNGEEEFAEGVTVPLDGITYTSKYSINTYKLTFKIGDDVLSESTVEYASAIEDAVAPEKEGYTFAGWSEHPEAMPASDLVITGSYTVNKYKLAYVIGETVILESEVEYSAAVTAPAAPEKEGHTFAGWSEHPETMPANDLVITGSYTVNKYKLAYVIGETVISESEVEYSAAITAPAAPEKEGHTFAGWVDVPETMPAGDVTVAGSYTINTYKLTFKIGDDVLSETTVEYASAIEDAVAPEKEGYTFAGWSEHPEIMPANDVTIIGSYTINSYKLVFKIEDDVISETTVEYASAVEEPAAPTKDGYIFAGWNNVPVTMPAEDVTINGSYVWDDRNYTFKAIGGYQTLSLPYDAVVPEGVTIYSASLDASESWVNLSEETINVLPANTGVVVTAAAEDDYTFLTTTTNPDQLAGNNILQPTGDGEATLSSLGLTSVYLLAKHGDSEEAFYKYVATKALPANKAYFEWTSSKAAPARIRINTDVTTGIEMSDGNADAVYYDLGGRRIGNANRHGVVIRKSQNNNSVIVR